MLKKVHIKKFRKFNNREFNIASRLTLISGANGIGKSTLIGLVASGSGTKEFKTLGNKDFHPFFGDYFILHKSEHKKATSHDHYEVCLDYSYKGTNIKKRLRTSHPNEPKLKLVPRTISIPGFEDAKEILAKTGVGASGRIPIPTYFVSTGRLFPFGESNATDQDLTKVKARKNIKDQEAIIEKYINFYNAVLPFSISKENVNFFESYKPKIQYRGFYVEAVHSSVLTQSIGQDSLSAIINALLSFENISGEPKYTGGILCIDELDASLHPDAQFRLLNLLKEQADRLNLQIIFTSHSLTLIKEMMRLTKRDSNKYSVLYFRNLNNPSLNKVDSYTAIKADLFASVQFSTPKVKLYVEDDEAKFALEQIMNIYEQMEHEDSSVGLKQCEIIVSQIGCDTLLRLPTKDNYFKDVVVVLDGDSKFNKYINVADFLEEEPKGLNEKLNIPSNVVFLPDVFSPEATIFRFLYNISKNEVEHDQFWRSVEANPQLANYHAYNILIELQEMIDKKVLSREPFKDWFQRHQSFFEQSDIYRYYYTHYKDSKIVKDFGNSLLFQIKIKLEILKSKGF